MMESGGSDESRIPRFMQKSMEWYTPLPILRAVRAVLGTIELDPASCELANKTVQATRYYDKNLDGLVRHWEAKTVWLNPPYCKSGAVSNQELWTCKLLAEYEAGHVEQAILLVNAATETRWFQRLYAYPLCFVRGRIRFNSPVGTNTGSTVGSAFVYFGVHVEQFVAVFRRFGVIVTNVTPSQEVNRLWREEG
jgi:ParB family transcriptional regulator, chromosome partitioning protein